MIRSFATLETKLVWKGVRVFGFPFEIQRGARRKLRMINNSTNLYELRVPPKNRLEKLRGNRAGQFSIRINDQWRVCFRWVDGDAYDVEITDYH